MSRKGERIEREKKEKKKLHDLACEYFRMHEVGNVPVTELYMNSKKPFREHKKSLKNAQDCAWKWYNEQVLPLISDEEKLDIMELGFVRVLRGISESLSCVTYIKDEEGKLMAVPDNRTRHESNKFLYSIQKDLKEKASGEAGGSNKVTIEITGNQLQTARDVWDDIQD